MVYVKVTKHAIEQFIKRKKLDPCEIETREKHIVSIFRKHYYRHLQKSHKVIARSCGYGVIKIMTRRHQFVYIRELGQLKIITYIRNIEGETKRDEKRQKRVVERHSRPKIFKPKKRI